MEAKHNAFMQRCLDLALRGLGNTAPNPLVGAVLVHQGEIIGEGWHQKYGEAHAEVNCFANVSNENQKLIPASTLYVNLEPCSHYGKTPPCAELVISKKVKKLVYANTDPNPLVAGKGLKKIRDAGVEIIGPVMEKEGALLNKRFFTFQEKQRPYIILKWAQSNDGFINQTAGQQNWITGKAAQILTHQWRYEEAAILVGANTVKIDNPQLSNRTYPGTNHPLRIVLDLDAELNFDNYTMGKDGQAVLIFNAKKQDKKGVLEWIQIDPTDFLKEMLKELFSRGVQSLIVEGGGHTLKTFIAEELWDEARILTGSKKFKEGLIAPKLPVLAAEKFHLDRDVLSIFYK